MVLAFQHEFLHHQSMIPTEFSLWQKFWVLVVLLIAAYFTVTGTLGMFFPVSALTVIGEGHTSVKPEKLTLIVTRVNASSDPSRSIDEGDAGVKVLIDTTKSVVGVDAKIQQSFYQVTPIQQSDLSTIYQLANAFSVETTQVGKTSELIKSLYRDGATTVSNISFTSSDQATTEQEARILAVKDAHDKALQIAKSAGKHVGRLVSITDDNVAASSTVGSTSTATQIGLDTIDIGKRVSVVYEIW